jgi:hypothetical protein
VFEAATKAALQRRQKNRKKNKCEIVWFQNTRSILQQILQKNTTKNFMNHRRLALQLKNSFM